MSTFTLAISCLTTSNLPWFMDLIFQVPMPYCSLQHQTLLPSRHIHNWVLFLLWLFLFILSGVISPMILSSLLVTYQPGEFIFQCPNFLPFHDKMCSTGKGMANHVNILALRTPWTVISLVTYFFWGILFYPPWMVNLEKIKMVTRYILKVNTQFILISSMENAYSYKIDSLYIE